MGDALLEVGDTYLLCSDGLHGAVSDSEIHKASCATPRVTSSHRCRRWSMRRSPPAVRTTSARYWPGRCCVEIPPGRQANPCRQIGLPAIAISLSPTLSCLREREGRGYASRDSR